MRKSSLATRRSPLATFLLLLVGAVWAVSSLPTGDGAPLPGAEVYRRTLRGVAWVHSLSSNVIPPLTMV